MSKNLLVIFVKNPEINKVKTRLAKSVGGQNALMIYRKLLEHTHKVTSALKTPADKQVWYSSRIDRTDLWETGDYEKHLQQGETLGKRMEKAFEDAFETGYARVVIIGSDCPGLETTHLEAAFQHLNEQGAVIGPAEDGGYYLLGMTEFLPSVFRNITWSEPTVLQQTKERLTGEGLSIYELETLNDIDTAEDLKQSNISLT